MGWEKEGGNTDLVRPGLAGRGVRLILGVLLALWAAKLSGQAAQWTGPAAPLEWGWSSLGWVGVAAMVWSQESFFTIGLNRPWGRKPQLAWAAIAVALALWNWSAGGFRATGGSWWGPPLGWWIYGTTLAMAILLSASFLLASLRATPG